MNGTELIGLTLVIIIGIVTIITVISEYTNLLHRYKYLVKCEDCGSKARTDSAEEAQKFTQQHELCI